MNEVVNINLNDLAQDIHQNENRKWWYDSKGCRLDRNKGELLMLIVSEIAEAMEGERKNLQDDKLLRRSMAEVELADAVIRILDYSAAHGYDIDGAVREKRIYNQKREDHKKEADGIAKGVQW